MKISAALLAMMVLSEGLPEGTTESELHQHLLDKQATANADTTPPAAADTQNPQANAATDNQPSADEGTTEERIVALAGDRIQALNADLSTAQTLAAERLASLNAANTRIAALEAQVAALGQKAEGGHTSTEKSDKPNPRTQGKSHFDLIGG